jgi:hypothetical protein
VDVANLAKKVKSAEVRASVCAQRSTQHAASAFAHSRTLVPLTRNTPLPPTPTA